MNRIGDLSGMMDDMNRRRQEYRRTMIAKNGWPQDVRCVECGDQGVLATGLTCDGCEKGREITERKLREKLWQEMMPRRFRSYTLESHPYQDYARQARAWLEHDFPAGTNLILSGGVGSGKTGLAIGIAREVYFGGNTVLFRTVPDLMDMLRPMSDNDTSHRSTMAYIQRVPLLVMDDFGVEKVSEWVEERLYLIINSRYERTLPTIVTTNHGVGDLKRHAGERMVSRLCKSSVTMPVTGPDLRTLS
jgi:DNA replication protein DnaC